jgi:hypothetical protein
MFKNLKYIPEKYKKIYLICLFIMLLLMISFVLLKLPKILVSLLLVSFWLIDFYFLKKSSQKIVYPLIEKFIIYAIWFYLSIK